MGITSIQWTDRSVNPIRARHVETGAVGHYCEVTSPGCGRCYASRLQPRFKMPPYEKKYREAIEPFFDESRLQEVLGRQKPTRFFWCDMTDLFGEWVPDEWIDKCFAVMALKPNHTHQVLTKRAHRMAHYINDIKHDYDRLERAARDLGYTLRFRGIPLVPWPLESVWLGFSAENQTYFDSRAVECASLARDGWLVWVSAEPLLDPINMESWLGSISWVVVGGESGRGARGCNVEWVHSIVRQCRKAKAACFVKQLGSLAYRKPGSSVKERVVLTDAKGGDIDEWPEDLRIREFPTVVSSPSK